MATCDTLEDVRTALDETDYGSFLQDEPAPLYGTTIVSKCKQRLANEFAYLRAQASADLDGFMDFLVRDKMIDNCVSLLQGALNGKSPKSCLIASSHSACALSSRQSQRWT